MATEKNEEGRWVSPGHNELGEAPTRSFLGRIGTPKKIIEQVIELVREHMVHIGTGDVTRRQARRLLVRLETASPDDLFKVIQADHSGRPPLPQGMPKRAEELKVRCDEVANEIKPFVQGRHLIALGMKPGRHFGPILAAAFEAQIDGIFSDTDEGIIWIKAAGLV